MKYNMHAIADELQKTAQGDAYYGNALYVARDFDHTTQNDKLMLTRWLFGNQTPQDRFRILSSKPLNTPMLTHTMQTVIRADWPQKPRIGNSPLSTEGNPIMTKFYFMQDTEGTIFQTTNPEYHPKAEKLPQAKGKELYRAQCIEEVRAMLENVDTVYGIVRHVSASGMSRDIDLYIIQDNRPVYLTGYASTILGYPMSKNRGMKVGGCGMDMVFHCVSSIAEAIGRDYKTLKSEII